MGVSLKEWTPCGHQAPVLPFWDVGLRELTSSADYLGRRGEGPRGKGFHLFATKKRDKGERVCLGHLLEGNLVILLFCKGFCTSPSVQITLSK